MPSPGPKKSDPFFLDVSSIRFDGESTGEDSAERNTLAAENMIEEARLVAESCVRIIPPPPPNALAKLAALAATALLVYGCMMATPKPMDKFSDVWQRVLYLPVIATSLMFGFRVGLGMASAVAALCAWHIQRYWGGDFLGENLNRSIEAGLLLVVGGLTGYLSGLIQCERYRAVRASELLDHASRLLLTTSQDLRRSMDKLKRGAYEMMALQQRLQRADRLAALGTMTAGLAHEIRNPLGSIKGAAEVLADRAGGDKVAREFADILILESNRLNDVLTNFLRFARGSRFHGEAADARQACVEMLELVGHYASRCGATVKREFVGDEPLIASISGGSLRQAIFNLLLNACQALADHGGERIIELRCGVCQASDQVCVEVADSGPGVPEEVRDKIFDPFFTTKEVGTGLGLAIVARIIDDARGELTLFPPEMSRLGGANFEIKIPRASSKRRKGSPASSAAAGASSANSAPSEELAEAKASRRDNRA